MSRRPGPVNHDPFSPLLPSRTPGPLGTNDAAAPNSKAHLGDTPGPLGVEDGVAHRLAGGGGSPVAMMLLKLVMAATSETGPIKDPIPKSIAVTQFNFASVDKRDLHKKIEEIARSLGGQNHTNGVLFRLGGNFGVRLLRDIYHSAGSQNLDPRFLAAAFFAEANWAQFDPKHLDSFDFVGMDRFLKEYPSMVGEGILPPDFKKQFKKTPDVRFGETGERHHVAKFKNIDRQIEAFAALLNHRRKMLLQDLSAEKIGENDLTADELDYWTYVYYNGGSSPEAGDPRGTGKKHLIEDRVKKSGVAGVHVPAEKIQDPWATGLALGNGQRVLATKRLLQWAGMADPADPSSQEIKFISNLFQSLSKISEPSR
jgi:hypothetical protein